MSHASTEHLWSSLWSSRFEPAAARLRFQLGGEEFDNISQHVPRFLQAHRRACAVADALFHDSCLGIVAWNGQRPKSAGLPSAGNGFDALQATGFHPRHHEEWQAAPYPAAGGGETRVWTFRSYEMSRDKVARDTLLWHAIAAEMPISPSAPVVTFLTDPTAALMLHVYDDRGMDVMADHPAKLRGTYSAFADWLLDYDRGRMTNLFG